MGTVVGGRGYGDIYLLGAFKRDGRGGASACCLSPGSQNQWGMHAGSRSSLSPLSLLENNVFLMSCALPKRPFTVDNKHKMNSSAS